MRMKYISIITSLSFIAAPQFVLAGGNFNDADNLLQNLGNQAGVGQTTIESTAGTAVGILLSVIGLIFFVLMIYAGITWLTARGDEGQVDKARKIITSTVIGLVLVISTYAITYFVLSQFGQ